MHVTRIGIAGAIVLSSLASAAPVEAGTAPVFAAVMEGSNHVDRLVVGRLGGSATTILKQPDRTPLSSPAVSPSGNRIAFEVGDDSNQQLAVINADGSGELMLTNTSDVGYAGIVWSADERTIFTERYDVGGSGQSSVWRIPTDDSGHAVAISGTGEASPASLRPGGHWLGLNTPRHSSRGNRCAVVRVDGSDRKSIGPDECQLPIWRPNKSQLAVGLITTNGIEGKVTIQLWMLTLSGDRHVVPHTQSASTYGQVNPLAWTDDGQFVYYKHYAGKFADTFHVYRIRPDGTGKKDLTPDVNTAAVRAFSVQPAS